MSATGDRLALRDAHDDRQNVRAVDDALLRAFCAVQALCAGAIGVAYPAVLYALATWIFIFTGIVVARELTETHIRDEKRRRVVFGYCWAALWHLWLPCCLLNRWDYFSFHFPSWVYGSGTLLWALLSFYQRLLGLPWTARASADSVIILGMSVKPPWSPLSDVREYLHAGADGALDKGDSAALQTDVLARVYHDRFPDRSAGAAPKRARRE